MTDIKLDDEPVEFTHGVPSTLGELLELLHGAMDQRGRVVSSVACDGIEFSEREAQRSLATVGRIDVRTISMREALAAVAGECSLGFAAAEVKLAELNREVLRNPWSAVHEKCVAQVQAVGGLMERAVVLIGSPGTPEVLRAPLEQALSAVADALGKGVGVVGAGDAAAFCLQGETSLRPLLNDLVRLLGRLQGELA